MNTLLYQFARKSISKAKKNSNVLLAIVGSVGVVATGWLAAKTTPKAIKLIDSKKDELGVDHLDSKEVVETVWKCYLPTFTVGAVTIGCVIGSAVLSKNQQIALTGAYALTAESYSRYQNKVKELLGTEVHNEVVDAIVKEKAKDVHLYCPGCISDNCSLDVCETESPEIVRTFYDAFSDRYFESTLSRVIEAEYHFNRNFIMRGGASVNELYEFLGLDGVTGGEKIGWGVDDELYWVDFNHRLTKLDDGMEVFVLDMVYVPTTADVEDYYW